MHPDVEGYGVVSEGETYHPSAFFNPSEKFKYAGDPDKQAEYQDEVPESDVILQVTDEQSNADPATATVKIDEPLTGEQEAVEIPTKKPEVVTTSEDEPNFVVQGQTGVVVTDAPVEEVPAESDPSVNFE